MSPSLGMGYANRDFQLEQSHHNTKSFPSSEINKIKAPSLGFSDKSRESVEICRAFDDINKMFDAPVLRKGNR